MSIVEMTKSHMPAVVKMHRDSATTGMTAWLGQCFCEHLLWGIRSTPYSFLLVYEDEQHNPLGYICCTINISKMYKRIILRHFFPMAFSSITKLARPSIFKRAMIAVVRPKIFKEGNYSQWNLPDAELIAKGVLPEARNKGIGTKLIQAAFERFEQMGIDRIRTWTRDNPEATAFYQKRGFAVLGVREYDTGMINVLAADIGTAKEPES